MKSAAEAVMTRRLGHITANFQGVLHMKADNQTVGGAP
jgi:hypothetical protein